MNENGVSLELIELRLTDVDMTYQRCLKNYSKKIARDFDINSMTPPTLNRRPNKSLWIIDGQQRIAALKLLGFTHWKCRVLNLETVEQEAEVFGRINGSEGTSSKVTQSERFRALITARNPHALKCIEAVKAGGMLLVAKRHPGGDEDMIWRQIDCTGFILGWTTVNGYDMLTRGCRVVSNSWPCDKDSRRSTVIKSVFNLISTYPQIEDDRAILRFRSVPAITIDQKVKAARCHESTGAIPFLINMYNKGLRTRKIGQSTDLTICSVENVDSSPTDS